MNVSKKMMTAVAVSVGIVAVATITGAGLHTTDSSQAADLAVTATAQLDRPVRTVDNRAIGVGSSTYGANALTSTAQSTAEKNLDARYIRIPVGYRNGRVTSSAGGGPTNLDVPALVRQYQSWGYKVIAVMGGRTNDADLQPGDATTIIKALGTGPDIEYSAPNELGNQGKSIQDEISLARMIVAEGKRIDTTFKVWGPVWAYYDRAGIKMFAAALGADLAGIDYHHYAMGGESLPTAQALAETSSYATEINDIRSDLTTLGLGDRPINVDELNFSWRYNDGTPGGNNRFFTTTNTVWMASALGHILKAGGRGLPYASQNGPLGVMVEAGNVNPDNRPASSPMPAYWAIAAWTGGKIWPHYKDTVFNAATNDTSSEVYAVNNEAGGYNLILINKSETDGRNLNLSLTGVSAGTYSLYQTNASKPYDQPANLTTASYTPGSPLLMRLPAMSVSIIVLKPSPASPAVPLIPGDVNGDKRVNALDLSALISHDGQNYLAADFNKDGTVGAADLAILLSRWTW